MAAARAQVTCTDERGGSSDPHSDSSEDEVTEHVTRSTPADMAAARTHVPTISVTPHSPGVLDDSLQQLRRLHAAVQRMRAAPLPLIATGSSRLSTSCPSLCKDGVVEPDCSSPTHLDFYPQSRKGSAPRRRPTQHVGCTGARDSTRTSPAAERRDEGRRSTWAALEPGTRPEPHRQRNATTKADAALGLRWSPGLDPNRTGSGTPRRRVTQLLGCAGARDSTRTSPAAEVSSYSSTLNGHSASLSSMESEGEAPRPVRHSTHSLNDNDLAKDFEKVTAALRAGAVTGAACITEGSRLIPRLPLQKSVSTPSIVAAVQPPQPPQPINIRSGGGASETESDEDASAATVGATNQLPGRRNNAHQEHLGLHRLAFLEHGGDCDWCGHPLTDKPSLYCDTLATFITTTKTLIINTIKASNWMFADGMGRFPGVTGAQVARMFPRIDELWALHAALLSRLRTRQRLAPSIASIADILAETFAPAKHHKLKAAYASIADILAETFAPAKHHKLKAAYASIADILAETFAPAKHHKLKAAYGVLRARRATRALHPQVPNQPLAQEKDPKSFTNFRSDKFKKSNILQGNRSLIFEGVATLMQGRSKMQTLLVIVLTDVLFFLHDNNNKYTFFTPDNKVCKAPGSLHQIFEGVATLMQGRSKMQTLLVIVLTDVLFFLHDNNNKYTFFTPDN
ncbi:putative RHO guanyl-nucleotide exchange factor, partial [Operophtera brumata]